MSKPKNMTHEEDEAWRKKRAEREKQRRNLDIEKTREYDRNRRASNVELFRERDKERYRLGRKIPWVPRTESQKQRKNELQKIRRVKARPEILEKEKEIRKRNREQRITSFKKWASKNKNRIRDYAKKSYSNNYEKIRQSAKNNQIRLSDCVVAKSLRIPVAILRQHPHLIKIKRTSIKTTRILKQIEKQLDEKTTD